MKAILFYPICLFLLLYYFFSIAHFELNETEFHRLIIFIKSIDRWEECYQWNRKE